MIQNLGKELKDQKQYMKVMISELKKKDIVISAKTITKICSNAY